MDTSGPQGRQLARELMNVETLKSCFGMQTFHVEDHSATLPRPFDTGL